MLAGVHHPMEDQKKKKKLLKKFVNIWKMS